MSWLPLASSQSRLVSGLLASHVDGPGTDVTGSVQLDMRLQMQSPRVPVGSLQLALTGQILDLTLLSNKNGPSNFTVEAATEVSGVNTRFTYAAANQIPVLASDLINLSDVSIANSLPANTSWFLRCSQRVASLGTHMTRPFNAGVTYLFRNSYNNNASNQVAGTGAITTVSEAVTAWGPPGIVGIPQGNMTAVAWLGTSIDGGTGDTVDAAGQVGYWVKGLEALPHYVPGIALSHGQSQTTNFLATGGNYNRLWYQYVDVILMGAWTNDFATGNRTLAAVQADVLRIINGDVGITAARASGRKLFAATMLPRVGQSEVYTSPGGQVPLSGFEVGGKRDQYNTWLSALTDAGTIDGVIDLNVGRYKLSGGSWISTGASPVEDQSVLGVWDSTGGIALTADGTHPNLAGVTPMAASVTVLATALGW